MKGRKWAWGSLTGLALACLGGSALAQAPVTPMTGAPAGGVPGAAPSPVAPAAAPSPAAPAAPAGDTSYVALVNGVKITAAELEAALKSGGPSPVQLPEAVRRQRQIEVLGLLIDNQLMHQFLETNTPVVTPEEVNKRLSEMEVGLQAQGKSLPEFCHDTNQTLAQLKAGIADHLRWSAYASSKLNEAKLEVFYKENKDFFDNVTVRASHIVIRIPTGTTPAEKEKARADLTALRAQITSGKVDFAEAAKAKSQDPRAAHGGDLGFFPRKWVFDEPFAKAAFALQTGQVSEVVETDYGLHLIKVTERKPGKPSEYAKIKEAVREFCIEDMRQQVLNDLRKSGKIDIKLP